MPVGPHGKPVRITQVEKTREPLELVGDERVVDRTSLAREPRPAVLVRLPA
jgi:hypothetical protein